MISSDPLRLVVLLAIALVGCDDGDALPPELRAGDTIRLPVGPDRPARVTLWLEAGEHLVANVAQDGVDVALRLTDPSGRERLRVDWVGGREGSEPVCLGAELGGAWILTARARTGEPAGEVVVERPLAAPTDEDRVAAHEALSSARDARRRGDGASLREARDGYREARERFAALGDRWGEAQALDQLGRVYKTLGDRRRSLALRMEALAMREAAGDRFGVEISALGVGNLHDWFGDTEASLAFTRRALVAAQAIGDARGVATITTNLGMTWSDLGDYSRALAAYGEALATQEALGDEHGAAFSHRGLGDAYRRLGDAPRARAHITAALRLRERLGEERWAAGDHYALGLVHLELEGEYSAAIDELSTALKMRERLGYFSDREPQVRIAMARAYAELELHDEAKNQLAEARADSELLGFGGEAAELALGDVSLAAGEPAAAVDHYQRVLDGDDRFELLRNVLRAGAGLARARFALGDRDGAQVALEATLARIESVRASLDPTLLRGTWLGAWRDLHDLEVTLALTGPERDIGDAFVAHERGLARALLDEVDAGAEAHGITSVQRALAADQALVSLVLGDDRGWAFVVTPDDVEVVPLPPRDRIAGAARALVSALTARAEAPAGESSAERRARIARADDVLSDHAAQVAQLVWAPLAARLPERLVIVSDPLLEAVPFELLPGPDGEPALTRHQIGYAPSATTWLVLGERARDPAAEAVVVVADPVFGGADARLPPRAAPPPPAPFPRLRFSAVEAEAIRVQVPDAHLFTGLEAHRESLLSPAPEWSVLAGSRIVHFATHVVVDAVDPDRSALVLSLVDDAGAPIDQRIGLLTAGDVRGLELAAELVVLSGCASARGRAARGEGVMGLVSAFFEAGARRVIASRWQVHDRGTAALMSRLYAELAAGHQPGAALRRAALALRADPRWSAPYYWAAFGHVGGGG